MLYRLYFTYYNDGHKKQLMLIVFLSFINLLQSFVLVNTPSVYIIVPRNSSINLTCDFTDDKGYGIDAVRVTWTRSDKRIEEEIETTWNETSQVGETVLHVPSVSEEEEKFRCLVYVNLSVDYKNIKIQTIDITQKVNLDSVLEIIPPSKQVDICDGPPLKLNCSFKFPNWCLKHQVKVEWWEYNNDTLAWKKHVDGISWVATKGGGTGWLNISNPGVETTFLCVVTCGYIGNSGVRVSVPVPVHKGQKIQPRHSQYPAVKGMSVILVCNIDDSSYSESGWWFNGTNIDKGNKYTLSNKQKSMELVIGNVGDEDKGNYTCWVAKDGWWDAASVNVYITEEDIDGST
ncbi:V-type Ig domain containing protein [Fowlpox virus]|nr:V-type Ig domain containing protein [Fowlpox virus]AXY04829.1 V-type Ig domain containing protein [Fowlpox virus]